MEPAQNVLTRSQQHNLLTTRYVQLVHNWARFMPAQRSFFFKIAVLVCQIAPSCDSATYISQTVLLNWERGGPRAGKSESFHDTAAPPNNTQCYLVYTVVWCWRYPVLKLPEIFRICCVCLFNISINIPIANDTFNISVMNDCRLGEGMLKGGRGVGDGWVGGGCRSKLHGSKVHGVRARTPGYILWIKGSLASVNHVLDKNMSIQHLK